MSPLIFEHTNQGENKSSGRMHALTAHTHCTTYTRFSSTHTHAAACIWQQKMATAGPIRINSASASKFDSKNLEIKTKSIEQTLVPLVTQVSLSVIDVYYALKSTFVFVLFYFMYREPDRSSLALGWLSIRGFAMHKLFNGSINDPVIACFQLSLDLCTWCCTSSVQSQM